MVDEEREREATRAIAPPLGEAREDGEVCAARDPQEGGAAAERQQQHARFVRTRIHAHTRTQSRA